MKAGFDGQCDLFIQRCQDALAMKDADEARRILVDATSIFSEIIPNWQGGLMGQFTEFYLDDARMILGKLSTFKANGCKASPRDFMKSRHVEAVIETDDLFEAAVMQIQTAAADGEDSGPIIAKLGEMQTICTSQLTFPERWAMIQPFLRWTAALDVSLAQHVLPLFMRCLK